ncbi:MAG: hypothetical protein WBA12_00135 [Catalinimonas sp.]
MLVEQHERLIEVHYRPQADTPWEMRWFTEEVTLRSLDLTLLVATYYAGTEGLLRIYGEKQEKNCLVLSA